MSQDLRIYSLSLLIVLMLWNTPTNAIGESYGRGCSTLAVPIDLDEGVSGVWTDDSDRELYPYLDTTAVSVVDVQDAGFCTIRAASGSYYDGQNHLWTLSSLHACNTASNGAGDFRAGAY